MAASGRKKRGHISRDAIVLQIPFRGINKMDFDKETQVRILQVAAGREEGKTFEELDERIAHVMDLHPEFDEIWKQGELAAYPQEINGQVVSPFVHTVLHVTVDKQITLGQPLSPDSPFFLGSRIFVGEIF